MDFRTVANADALAGVVLNTHQQHEDARGYLVELFRNGDSHCAVMGYLSKTLVGVTRGPHEHIYQRDMFVFMQSSFLVWLWDNREDSLTFGQRVRFTVTRDNFTSLLIPPGVVHAYQAIVDDGLVLNFPSSYYRGLDGTGRVDEIRHEDNPKSPFRCW